MQIHALRKRRKKGSIQSVGPLELPVLSLPCSRSLSLSLPLFSYETPSLLEEEAWVPHAATADQYKRHKNGGTT
ncbi:unnamed protein product [Spirodela intermedia]|uniref:Uncharacterized protein n=1 Tax=Spirodela intermedia TaxID=51605 RepID=A0A7I8IDQ8_SPIIN|nr:unnamed protein product [Spirodela intermedia]CAA6655799.1 unnamed protein product [Spirodela intermedia]